MAPHDPFSPIPDEWDIGTGVRGYRWQAAQPRAVLLLQHGYAEYAERYVSEYAHLIPSLVAMGITVHAFDMRGHGSSPGEAGVIDVERAVSDHLAARKLLASQPLPVFLLGHSLGGLVTVGSVLKSPGKITGVILTSPALFIPTTRGQRAIMRVLAWISPARPMIPQGDPADHTRRLDLVDKFSKDTRMYRGPLPALLAASAARLSCWNRSRYSEWKAPVLIIHGTDDKATDPKGSEAFRTAILADDATLITVPDGRHELLNDIGAPDVLAKIIEWIEPRMPPP